MYLKFSYFFHRKKFIDRDRKFFYIYLFSILIMYYRYIIGQKFGKVWKSYLMKFNKTFIL